MRKLTVPKPLQHLNQDELGLVHSWFCRLTYAEMSRKIRETFGIEISVNQLTRYYARFSKAQLFNTVLYTPLTPSDMAALENADPIPDEINLTRIKEQCLRLALRPEIDALDLKHLHDILTYEERARHKEWRNDLDERILTLRHQEREIRDRRRQLAELQSQPE